MHTPCYPVGDGWKPRRHAVMERRGIGQVGNTRQQTRWPVSAAGLRVGAERKDVLNPFGEKTGARHAVAREVLAPTSGRQTAVGNEAL